MYFDVRKNKKLNHYRPQTEIAFKLSALKNEAKAIRIILIYQLAEAPGNKVQRKKTIATP